MAQGVRYLKLELAKRRCVASQGRSRTVLESIVTEGLLITNQQVSAFRLPHRSFALTFGWKAVLGAPDDLPAGHKAVGLRLTFRAPIYGNFRAPEGKIKPPSTGFHVSP